MNVFKRTFTMVVVAVTAAMSALPTQAAPLRPMPVLAAEDGLVSTVGHHRHYRHRHYRHHRHHRYRHRHYRHRRHNGAAIAGAVIGGIIIGSAIANSNRQRYVEPRRVYRGGLSQAHIRYCYNRYRSYRASDNTFQPYGNRPRRQCRSRY